jgi:hypothetical protein
VKECELEALRVSELKKSAGANTATSPLWKKRFALESKSEQSNNVEIIE